MSVCLSIRPSMFQSLLVGKLGSYCMDFHKIWYLRIFRKSVDNTQILLESYKNNENFIRRLMDIYGNVLLNLS